MAHIKVTEGQCRVYIAVTRWTLSPVPSYDERHTVHTRTQHRCSVTPSNLSQGPVRFRDTLSYVTVVDYFCDLVQNFTEIRRTKQQLPGAVQGYSTGHRAMNSNFSTVQYVPIGCSQFLMPSCPILTLLFVKMQLNTSIRLLTQYCTLLYAHLVSV